jgi:hypothetical protein
VQPPNLRAPLRKEKLGLIVKLYATAVPVSRLFRYQVLVSGMSDKCLGISFPMMNEWALAFSNHVVSISKAV